MAQRVRGALGAPRRRPRLLPRLLLLLLLRLLWPELARAAGRAPCPAVCTCAGDSLDCGGRGLAALPGDLPAWTQSLNLSYNKLSEIDPAGFEDLPNLQEVYLNHNELTAIPSVGAASSHVVSLFLFWCAQCKNLSLDHLGQCGRLPSTPGLPMVSGSVGRVGATGPAIRKPSSHHLELDMAL